MSSQGEEIMRSMAKATGDRVLPNRLVENAVGESGIRLFNAQVESIRLRSDGAVVVTYVPQDRSEHGE